MEPAIPDTLRFPAPPPGGARASEAEAAAFVGAVLGWRERIEQALRTGRAGLPPALTDRAAAFMLAALSSGEGSVHCGAAYVVRAFPAPVTADRRSLDALLRWRVGLADYLADVWDVIGEPAYELDECQAMGGFLRPVDADARCHSCLEVYPAALRHESAHACPLFAYVTAHWPGGPAG